MYDQIKAYLTQGRDIPRRLALLHRQMDRLEGNTECEALRIDLLNRCHTLRTTLAQIHTVINSVTDPRLQELLTCRFLLGMSMADTAHQLCVDSKYIYVLQRRALAEAEKTASAMALY